MTPEEIFTPYAIVALSAKEELRKVELKLKNETNKRNRSILKRQQDGLKHLIDRCFRLTGDFVPVHVSKLANEYCVENKLGDIFSIGWNRQSKFERKKNRKECNLKHEHKIPVSTLIEKLKDAKSLDEAMGIFESQEIVWVHKDEDKKLPKTKRPNPDEEYAKAGIEVIKNPHSIGHLFK